MGERPNNPSPRTSGLFRPMLYPNIYVWFVLFASLDILLTWVILTAGGYELNALADWVIRRGGRPGMVAYKFALVLFVILLCEIVGSRNRESGATLARWAVAITLFPVVVAMLQLLRASVRGTLIEDAPL